MIDDSRAAALACATVQFGGSRQQKTGCDKFDQTRGRQHSISCDDGEETTGMPQA
jgi:hypothetical protein